MLFPKRKLVLAEDEFRPRKAYTLIEHDRLINPKTGGLLSEKEKPDESGQVVFFQHWIAPALDCATLKATMERRSGNGVVNSKTEQVVVSVTPAEPDREMFNVPVGYEEVQPSDLQRRGMEAIQSGPIFEAQLQALKAADKLYYASKVHKEQ